MSFWGCLHRCLCWPCLISWDVEAHEKGLQYVGIRVNSVIVETDAKVYEIEKRLDLLESKLLSNT